MTQISKIRVFWQIAQTLSSLKKSLYSKITQPINDSISKDLSLSPKRNWLRLSLIVLRFGPISTVLRACSGRSLLQITYSFDRPKGRSNNWSLCDQRWRLTPSYYYIHYPEGANTPLIHNLDWSYSVLLRVRRLVVAVHTRDGRKLINKSPEKAWPNNSTLI